MIAPVGSSIAPRTAPGRSLAASGSTFQLPSLAGQPPSAAPSAAPLTAASAPAAMAGLLALQEFLPPQDHHQRSLQHGHALLAKLSRLQAAILGGEHSATLLDELSDLAATRIDTQDPRLRALITAVITRAQVELAKRGH